MDKLLGNTPSWGEVWKRFCSPVVIGGFIVLMLNFLRGQFGWEIPVDWIEKIINFIIYGGTTTFMAINDASNSEGL